MTKQKLDPNIVAYLADVKNGKFKDTKPGTWVAYYDGKFVFSHPSKKEFLMKLRKIRTGCFITQVNIVEEPIVLSNVSVHVRVISPKIKKIKKRES